jgi:TonB-linked SusC/RagA family outer membrane protein
MQSFLGRINYSLLDRYLLTISGRSDGSSKFGKGNKFGFFPSFALGWKAKEESFLKQVEEISALKIRISYGVTGNEGIAPYSSQSLLYPVLTPFGTNAETGYIPAQLSNDKIKWETSSQANIGFDLGLFRNKIEITADFYRKKTTDLLLFTPVPYLTGYGNAYLNVGSMENRGFEFAITAHPLSTSTFHWTTTYNMSMPRNKVLDLSGGEEGLVANPVIGISGWTRVVEGEPVGTFYGLKTNGIMQEGEDPASIPYFAGKVPEPGVRKYVNQNTDNIINEDDRVKLGNASPDFTFGWSNNFVYKNLSLSVFLQGNIGNEIVNFNKFSLESFTGNNNNSTAALERWTPENRSNKYPRADYSPDVSNVLSDHQVENGSYARIKDVTLNYSFPSKINLPVLKGASVYVSAKNVLTITKYTGYDPELSRFANNPLTMGADFGPYPNSRSVILGFTTSF